MHLVRRLFVVPLADNDHGKTTMIRALVSQGLGREMQMQRKGERVLVSPHGRDIDSYVFGRSYQEVEKGKYKTIENALDRNDSDWRERELVIMPSHVSDIENDDDDDDVDQMLHAAHSAGFDAICANVLFAAPKGPDRKLMADIWRKRWDERWTIPNPKNSKYEGQLDALGRDLWFWICRALAG